MRKQTRGQKVICFLQAYCLTPEGAHVGKPLKLEKFQKSFLIAIYDNPSSTRRGYLSIARKNGKSALIAGILLAHLCGPMDENLRQISAALDVTIFRRGEKFIVGGGNGARAVEILDQFYQQADKVVPLEEVQLALVEQRASLAEPELT